MRPVRWAVAAVLATAGLSGAGVTLHRHLVYGTVVTEDRLTTTVTVGDRLSLAVPDHGPSAGDSWTARTGTGGVLEPRGSRLRYASPLDEISGPAAGGGRGTRYFRYDARAAGTTTVTLSNCFQGCRNPVADRVSRSVTWTIAVH